MPERPLYEEVLDYLVYAPLGVASELSSELPRYVELGRRRYGNRVLVARFVGKSAVAQARRRLEGVLSEVLRERAPTADADSHRAASHRAASSPSAPRARATSGAEAGSSELAIPGYDSLAASQVVARLAGLSPDELGAVRDYEADHRRRRTILSRAAQLLEEGPDAGS